MVNAPTTVSEAAAKAIAQFEGKTTSEKILPGPEEITVDSLVDICERMESVIFDVTIVAGSWEAGAIVTSNPELVTKIRMLRDHGQQKKYHHAMIGWNARMDGIQGAVLSVKLKHLLEWNEARSRNAKIYNDLLDDFDEVIVPQESSYSKHVYHIYAIRVKSRDSLIQALAEKDIHCGIHYPVPVHLQEAYQSLRLRKGSFPIAEKCAGELVSLPMFPELTREQIEHVAKQIRVYTSINKDSDYLQPQTQRSTNLQRAKGALPSALKF